MKAKTKELADSVGAVYPVLFMGRHDGVLFTETELERFADLVAKHERKECARLCEDRGMVKGGEVFAARIRARGNT